MKRYIFSMAILNQAQPSKSHAEEEESGGFRNRGKIIFGWRLERDPPGLRLGFLIVKI